MCTNAVDCPGMNDPRHRSQFLHQCPQGKQCPRQYVTTHKEEFAHDLFSVEVRQAAPPMVVQPQAYYPPGSNGNPGGMPYRPLPNIPGMEGNGAPEPQGPEWRHGQNAEVYHMPSHMQPVQGQPVYGQPVAGNGSNAKEQPPVPDQHYPTSGVSPHPPAGVNLCGAAQPYTMPQVQPTGYQHH